VAGRAGLGVAFLKRWKPLKKIGEVEKNLFAVKIFFEGV
jgi:hypothetical protein